MVHHQVGEVEDKAEQPQDEYVRRDLSDSQLSVSAEVVLPDDVRGLSRSFDLEVLAEELREGVRETSLACFLVLF